MVYLIQLVVQLTAVHNGHEHITYPHNDDLPQHTFMIVILMNIGTVVWCLCTTRASYRVCCAKFRAGTEFVESQWNYDICIDFCWAFRTCILPDGLAKGTQTCWKSKKNGFDRLYNGFNHIHMQIGCKNQS